MKDIPKIDRGLLTPSPIEQSGPVYEANPNSTTTTAPTSATQPLLLPQGSNGGQGNNASRQQVASGRTTRPSGSRNRALRMRPAQNRPSAQAGDSGYEINGYVDPRFDFNADKMTVAGQMEGLLSQDNPYIRQARERAESEAAARGMRSSSQAVRAGEEAAIAQALPIAQADATTYYDRAKSQYQARSSASLQTTIQSMSDAAAMARTVKQGQMQSQLQTKLAEMGYAHEEGMARLTMDHQKALQEGDIKAASDLKAMEIEWNREQQGIAIDAQFELQYAQDTSRGLDRLNGEILAIQQNPKMKDYDKRRAIAEAEERWRAEQQFIYGLYGGQPGETPAPGDPSRPGIVDPGPFLGGGPTNPLPAPPPGVEPSTWWNTGGRANYQ